LEGYVGGEHAERSPEATKALGELGTVYEGGRRRIVELVADLDDRSAATPVSACPEWSVHDVIAHLAGVCADIMAGNVAGAATDPWTAAQ
jgi:Mycothiol maleylpyruvate isomerase N-terminal domain